MPIAVQHGQFECPSKDAGLPRGEESPHSLFMGLAESCGNDVVRQPLAEHLFGLPAEDPLGTGIPSRDTSSGIDGKDGIERGIEQVLELAGVVGGAHQREARLLLDQSEGGHEAAEQQVDAHETHDLERRQQVGADQHGVEAEAGHGQRGAARPEQEHHLHRKEVGPVVDGVALHRTHGDGPDPHQAERRTGNLKADGLGQPPHQNEEQAADAGGDGGELRGDAEMHGGIQRRERQHDHRSDGQQAQRRAPAQAVTGLEKRFATVHGPSPSEAA